MVLETPARRKVADIVSADDDAILAACKLVGGALGIDVRPHPDPDPRAGYDGRVMEIAKASRFRIRQVALRDDWWRRDHGPILARIEETDEPVALLPKGPRAYLLVKPGDGQPGTVTDAVAETLHPFGYVVYRRFPEGPLTAWQLVKFGARGLRSDAWALIATGVALGLLGTLTPYFTGKLFDTAIPEADRGLLFQFTAALFIAAIVSIAFNITQSIGVLRIQGKMDYFLQAAVWDRLLDLPSAFFRDYSAGDLAERAAGINDIRGMIAGAGLGSILGSLSSLFYVALMFTYDVKLALLAMLLTFIIVGFTTGANLLQLRHQRTMLELSGKITGLVLQLVAGIGKIRVSGAENHAFRIWTRDYAAQRRLEFKIGRIQNAVQIFGAGFPVFTMMVIFFAVVSLTRSMSGSEGLPGLTTGEFIAFSGAFGAFQSAIQALSGASLSMLQIVPTYERLKPIIITPEETDESKAHPGVLKGQLEMSHVSFRYTEEGALILDDLSLKIQPGEFIAFVGGSGCGKSTMMRLMLGFEEPEKGSIYYDGQDLASLDLREVRAQIGVVLQNSQLLPADIFRNIIGTSNLTIDDAWEAARLAGLSEDIEEMPMGMHTYVSEGGGGLSGGQQQRLMIARALVRRPRILFFDEATSALDNRAQAQVTESMERLQATRIVIAHRLSTIINANRICYLEGGTIAEQGTYEELMKLDGLFAQLARRQMA
jgi:ATP-binding cassette subfamily C protein